MSERKLPELHEGMLRDHGSSVRVERGWKRLSEELGPERGRPRAVWWWAPAAAMILFGAGVFVGARWGQVQSVAPHAALQAEPLAPYEPAGQETPSLEPADNPVQPKLDDKPSLLTSRPLATTSSEQLETPDPVEAAPVAAPVQAAGPPEWQKLGNQGEWSAAAKLVDEQPGGFDGVVTRATAEQLMALVDIARGAGRRDRALIALRRVLSQFPGDPNAPLAAWTLGTMLDKSGDKAGAAQAFAEYQRLSPKGDFAEDALARRVEAAIDRGDLEQARTLADKYAKEFPKGRRLVELKRRVAKLAGAPPPPAPDAGVGEDSEESVEEEEPALPSGDQPAPAAPPH